MRTIDNSADRSYTKVVDAKNRVDAATGAVLGNLYATPKDATRMTSEIIALAHSYKLALLEAADQIAKGEAAHYRELARLAVPKAEFFVAAVQRFRLQNGLDQD